MAVLGQILSVLCMLLCPNDSKTSFNKLGRVEKQALRAYCPNIYIYIYCVPCWNIKINILTSCANEDQHIKVELMGGQGMLNLKSYQRFSFLKLLPINRYSGLVNLQTNLGKPAYWLTLFQLDFVTWCTIKVIKIPCLVGIGLRK
jgi:hypothetical protein